MAIIRDTDSPLRWKILDQGGNHCITIAGDEETAKAFAEENGWTYEGPYDEEELF